MEESQKLSANRAIAYIREKHWAILPETLEMIHSIAMRDHDPKDFEALLAKPGMRLQGSERVQVRDGVAILGVEGPIFRYSNLFTAISGAESYQMLSMDLDAALNNPAIKAVILNINSPGGQVDGASEFSSMVRNARKKKPVIAYVSHLGASAAYWIASAAERVVVEKGAMVGSIGTVATIRTDSEKNEFSIVSSQSPKKRPDVKTDEGKQQIQSLVDAQAQVFIESVASNRGVSAEDVVAKFGQGGLLMAASAVHIGMADSVGTLESLIAELANSSTRREVKAMDEKNMTRAVLATDYPALLAVILAEGGTVERERIKSVQAQMLPGHEALIETLKFDGKTTGAEAAVQVLGAERGMRATQLEAARSEAPKPVSASADPAPKQKEKEVPAIDGDASVEDLKATLKGKWDGDADLRADYANDFDAYVHYERQRAKGNVSFITDNKKSA